MGFNSGFKGLKIKPSETVGLQILFVLSSLNISILFHWPGCLFNPAECGSSLVRKLVNFFQAARRHMPESSSVHNICHEKIVNYDRPMYTLKSLKCNEYCHRHQELKQLILIMHIAIKCL